MPIELVESSSDGPGGVLANARQALGYTIGDVAKHLRLSKETIAALEENHFDQLPGATYIKGYIRSYARLLDLEADALVTRFNTLFPSAESTVFSTTLSAPNKGAWTRMFNRTFAVFILSSVLVVLWWFEHEPIAPALAENELTEPEVLSSEQKSRQAVTGVSLESQVAESPQRVKGDSEIPTRPEPVLYARRAKPNDSPEAPALAGVPAPQIFAAEAASLVPLEAYSPAPVEPVNAVPITLSFADPSWTEVYDADNHRLLFDLVKAGVVQKLGGRPPFKVTLGNAPGVKIVVNGQPFDHLPFSRRDNTARFVVKKP